MKGSLGLLAATAVQSALHEAVDIVVFCGPSGVGKGTMGEMLIKLGLAGRKVRRVAAACTRPSREAQELEGQYKHITKEEFKGFLQKEGDLLTHYQVGDNHYGYPKAWVDEVLESGDIPLLDAHVSTVSSILDAYPRRNVKVIFITVPDTSMLRERLIARGERSAEIERRMALAREEMEAAAMLQIPTVSNLPGRQQTTFRNILKELQAPGFYFPDHGE